MTDRTDTALALIRSLTLPDGRPLAETLPADPWIERDILRPILARGEDGLPLHRHVWVELARGHYKTGAIAAVAIAEAVSEFGTDIVCVASDADQARLIVEAIAGQCFRNPKLASAFKQGRDEFLVKRNRSRIRVFSSDAPSFFGLGVDSRRLRIVCDEICMWRDRAMLDAALTTLPKVADSQLIALTNAGTQGSWQEDARATFAADGYLFAAPGVIASWISEKDLERVRRAVPDAVYRRFYENQWTLSAGDFITQSMLAACVDESMEPRGEGARGERYYVGLDLGLSHDRTVRTIVHYDRRREAVVLDAMRVWEGDTTSPVSIAEVERDLLDVNRRFVRPLFVLDPWQLKGSIERLRPVLNVQEYTFSAQSVMKLSETLFSLISGGRLLMYPDRERDIELLQLQVKQTSVGWRIDHQRGGFSDRAISLGLAALTASERGPTRWLVDGVGVGADEGLDFSEMSEAEIYEWQLSLRG